MLFSLAESSVVAANEYKIKNLIKQDRTGSAELLKIVRNKSKYLSSIIFCNTLVNLLGSMIIGAKAMEVFSQFEYTIFVTTVTTAMLFISEIKPKVFAASYPERVGCIISKPLTAITWLLTPIIAFINLLVGSKNEAEAITICELDSMLRSANDTGVINNKESKLIQNVFSIRDKVAGDLVLRGGDIVTTPIHEQISTAKELATTSELKRFIAVNKHNQPVGVVFKSDILGKLLEDHEGMVIAEIVHPVLVVQEDKSMVQLLERLYKTDTHLAVVVNADGEMQGVITLSNIQQTILSL
jgi:CBS domain containing-hemolysin-like protein